MEIETEGGLPEQAKDTGADVMNRRWQAAWREYPVLADAIQGVVAVQYQAELAHDRELEQAAWRVVSALCKQCGVLIEARMQAETAESEAASNGN
jgi:hypothetical protein